MVYQCLGFGLAISWLWVSFLNGPVLENGAKAWSASREFLFVLFMGAHVLTYLGIGISGQIRRLLALEHVAAAAAVLLSLGVIVLALPEPAILSILYINAVLCGIAATVFLAYWLESFTRLPVHYAGPVFAIGIAMAALTTIVSLEFLVNPLLLTVIGAVLPLISYGLYYKYTRGCAFLRPQGVVEKATGFPYPLRFIPIVVLFYLAGAQIHRLTFMDSSLLLSFWLSNISYAVVCLAAGALMYRNKLDSVSALFRPVLPLMSIGFFSVPLFLDTVPLLPFLLLQAGIALFDMYTWLYVAQRAAQSDSPFTAIGLGMFLITGSILLSEAVFSAVVRFTPVLSHIDVVVFVGGIFSMYAAFYLRDEQRAPGEIIPAATSAATVNGHEELPETAAPAVTETTMAGTLEAIRGCSEKNADADEQIKSFAARYRLTPREQEVLEMLLKGRNGAYIREKLNISENTVKFHLRNLYGKVAVRNRQELLDLYDSVERAG